MIKITITHVYFIFLGLVGLISTASVILLYLYFSLLLALVDLLIISVAVYYFFLQPISLPPLMQNLPPYSQLPKDKIRFVCISDTHNQTNFKIPEGDVLLHTGDFTRNGTVKEVQDFNEWFSNLPHPIKIVIAGNHDLIFETEWYEKNWHLYHSKNELEILQGKAPRDLLTGCKYLEEESWTIPETDITIYGTPYQPNVPRKTMAFNRSRGPKLNQHWDKIPTSTTILMTHCPPHLFHDRVFLGGKRVGDEGLLAKIKKVRPLVSVYGHIHEAYGASQFQWNKRKSTLFINCATCDLKYKANNHPLVFDLPRQIYFYHMCQESEYFTLSNPSDSQ